MKPHKSILLLPIMLTVQIAFAQGSHLTLSDNYPSASEKIKIAYKPAGTSLSGKKNISAQVFFIDGKDYPVKDVDLKGRGQLLEGEFSIPATAKAFFVKIFSGTDIDNNDGKGYIFPVYKNKKPVARAYESEGFILAASEVGANFGGIKTDDDAAIALYKKEHDVYPGGEKKYEFNYYYLISEKQDERSRAVLISNVNILKKSDKEADLHLAAAIYGWLGEKSSADSLINVIKTRFPKGESVTREAVYAIFEEKEIGKKDSLYKDFMAKYPDNKNPDLDFIRTGLVLGYLEAGNSTAAEKYAALVQKKSSLASTYNGVAYEWALEDSNLERAEKLSRQALDIILEEQKHLKIMPFYSPKEVGKLYADMYNKYADSYVYILYRQKRYNEALKYQKEVYAHVKKNSRAIVEHYVLILNKLSKYDESKRVIEGFLKMNESNDVLYNELKTAYVGLNRSEAGFNEYFDATSKQSMN
jgi:hypothetical protein